MPARSRPGKLSQNQDECMVQEPWAFCLWKWSLKNNIAGKSNFAHQHHTTAHQRRTRSKSEISSPWERTTRKEKPQISEKPRYSSAKPRYSSSKPRYPSAKPWHRNTPRRTKSSSRIKSFGEIHLVWKARLYRRTSGNARRRIATDTRAPRW